MPERHEASEFGEILNSPEQPLIVGGQAVNIWAEYFAPQNAKIAAQRPFVSKDADIFGDRALAQKLADATGWEITFFHEPRTIAVAALIKRRPDAETLTVEVLREVRGLTRKELSDSDLVELRPGHVFRIPSPIRLLKAKLANLLQIKPARTNDIYHVRLLTALAHDYLGHMHVQVADRHLTERARINALHELHDVITAAGVGGLVAQYDFNLASSLPTDLPTAGMPKLAAFYEHYRRLNP